MSVIRKSRQMTRFHWRKKASTFLFFVRWKKSRSRKVTRGGRKNVKLFMFLHNLTFVCETVVGEMMKQRSIKMEMTKTSAEVFVKCFHTVLLWKSAYMGWWFRWHLMRSPAIRSDMRESFSLCLASLTMKWVGQLIFSWCDFMSSSHNDGTRQSFGFFSSPFSFWKYTWNFSSHKVWKTIDDAMMWELSENIIALSFRWCWKEKKTFLLLFFCFFANPLGTSERWRHRLRREHIQNLKVGIQSSNSLFAIFFSNPAAATTIHQKEQERKEHEHESWSSVSCAVVLRKKTEWVEEKFHFVVRDSNKRGKLSIRKFSSFDSSFSSRHSYENYESENV